jgi:hypothetical protein
VAVDGVRLAVVLHLLVAVSRAAKPFETPVELQFQHLGQGCALYGIINVSSLMVYSFLFFYLEAEKPSVGQQAFE